MRTTSPFVCDVRTYLCLCHHINTDLHQDVNNVGESFIITFGSYTRGGELFIYDTNGKDEAVLPQHQHTLQVGRRLLKAGMKVHGRKINTKGLVTKFDATVPHMVLPANGVRNAVVY